MTLWWLYGRKCNARRATCCHRARGTIHFSKWREHVCFLRQGLWDGLVSSIAHNISSYQSRLKLLKVDADSSQMCKL